MPRAQSVKRVSIASKSLWSKDRTKGTRVSAHPRNSATRLLYESRCSVVGWTSSTCGIGRGFRHAPVQRMVRAAGRPLQPTRPPSLTHIAQVCGGWTFKNLVNPKQRPGLAQFFEQTPPHAEQHRCQGDFQPFNHTQVQVLLDHMSSTRDTNVTTACGF